MKQLRLGDGVKRHLIQEYPVDMKTLSVEDKPSRQRRRLIARQIMKKFKRNKKNV